MEHISDFAKYVYRISEELSCEQTSKARIELIDIYKLMDDFSSNELCCQDDSLPSVTESNDYGVKETIYTSIYNVVSGEDML